MYSHDAQMMTRNCSNLARKTETKFDYIYVLLHNYIGLKFAFINNTHVQVIEPAFINNKHAQVIEQGSS